MNSRIEKLILTALVTVYVLLAGAYNFVTPAFVNDQHNPDENAHVLYVQTLAGGHLPVCHPGAANYEAHQPPLYYALCVPVYALAHGDSAQATRALRWVSTLLGALLIIVTWAAARGMVGLHSPADEQSRPPRPPKSGGRKQSQQAHASQGPLRADAKQEGVLESSSPQTWGVGGPSCLLPARGLWPSCP